MTDGATLKVRQINHGQSEIWLEADGNELSLRRTLATNEVINVTRHLCPADVFEAFYHTHYREVGLTASLSTPNLDEIAVELKLQS